MQTHTHTHMHTYTLTCTTYAHTNWNCFIFYMTSMAWWLWSFLSPFPPKWRSWVGVWVFKIKRQPKESCLVINSFKATGSVRLFRRRGIGCVIFCLDVVYLYPFPFCCAVLIHSRTSKEDLATTGCFIIIALCVCVATDASQVTHFLYSLHWASLCAASQL